MCIGFESTCSNEVMRNQSIALNSILKCADIFGAKSCLKFVKLLFHRVQNNIS